MYEVYNHMSLNLPVSLVCAKILEEIMQLKKWITGSYIYTLSHLKLQRQGEALCSTMEAPGSLSQAVEGRHLILGAQACSGHQGAPTQEYMVATSTKTGTWLSSGKCRNNERFYSARHAVQ